MLIVLDCRCAPPQFAVNTWVDNCIVRLLHKREQTSDAHAKKNKKTFQHRRTRTRAHARTRTRTRTHTHTHTHAHTHTRAHTHTHTRTRWTHYYTEIVVYNLHNYLLFDACTSSTRCVWPPLGRGSVDSGVIV